MSDTPYIYANYWEKFSPKEVFQLFLDKGWQPGYQDNVLYVKAKDEDHDPQYVDRAEFSLEEFVDSHGETDPVRIDLNFGEFLGKFHFYEKHLSIMLLNVVYTDDDWPIPDFCWYLKELVFFFEYAGVRWYECGVS